MSQQTPYLQNAIDTFKRYYPDLDDLEFLKDERHYKVEASFAAQDMLSRTNMELLLKQGKAEELLKSIKTIFRSKTNLPSPQEKIVVANIPAAKAEEFSQALHDFLYGQASWNERLARFANAFEAITGTKPSWPHLTLFPFLVFPTKHIFLKPDAMQKAAKVLGYQWDYKSSPDSNTYHQFQQLAQHLKTALKGLGAKDMIDVQSFLWVLAGTTQNAWLFQANPEYYDLNEELSGVNIGDKNSWSVDRYRSEMKPGDVALLWQSGQEAGVYAIGQLTDEPREYDWQPTQEEIEESPYLKAGWLVEFEYTDILEKPLSRSVLKQHPLLSQMQVIKMPRATVFRVSQEEWRELRKMIKDHSRSGRSSISNGGSSDENKLPTIDALSVYVNARGFHFPRELLTTYYLSLQTKPFVILTGISGTGKTKLTQLFADWMSPAIKEETVEIDTPIDSDDVFYLDVKPYYFKSGFVIPVKAYRYFNIPEVGQTVSVKIELEQQGKVTEAKYRHQRHTKGNSYVYFFSNDAMREWFKANFKVGEFLAFRVVDGGQKFRLEKFQPIKKQLVKQKPHHVFLSVKPDWTDNRGLLGFYNLITQTYQTTDFMRLLTQATIEPEAPYFIILDEMNLAKVEYYFADFLSVLESRYVKDGKIKQEMLRLHDLPRCVLAQGETPWDDEAELAEDGGTMCPVRCEGCPLRYGVDETHWSPSWASTSYAEAKQAGFKPERYVPPRLLVPINTYFTGTVNVDETTYMFSPKVLDRANTIEFNQVNLADYFAASMGATSSGSSANNTIRQQFTTNGQFIQLPKNIPHLRTDPTLTLYCQRLNTLNEVLTPYTMHFGYRVADEILLYLWHAHQLEVPDFNLDTAFDYQIYQKVLPKLHGSEAKLKDPLTVLREFCQQHNCPRSLAKIERMLSQLMKEGFASFA